MIFFPHVSQLNPGQRSTFLLISVYLSPASLLSTSQFFWNYFLKLIHLSGIDTNRIKKILSNEPITILKPSVF